MQYPGDCRVGGEETGIGDFHHFVGNRRHNCFVTAINDIGEPVAIVLEECLIAVVERHGGGGAMRVRTCSSTSLRGLLAIPLPQAATSLSPTRLRYNSS